MTQKVIEGSIPSVEVFKLLLGLQNEIQTIQSQLDQCQYRIGQIADSLVTEKTNDEDE